MPFVAGFLRVRRRPGRPDIGLPDPEGEVDPGYGIEEGGHPDQGLPDIDPPQPPAGIWPPLTPEQPWRPVDPGWGVGLPDRPSQGPVRPTRPGQPDQGLPGQPARPDQGLPGQPGQPDQGLPPTAGQLPVFPPGAIWPPLPPDVHGKFIALVLVGGMPGVRYRYVIIDADAHLKPSHPIAPGGPEAQPK